MKIILISFVVGFVALSAAQASQAEKQSEYVIDDPNKDNKIIGFSHLESFLQDLQKKIAQWTKDLREAVAMKDPANNPNSNIKRSRRQAMDSGMPSKGGLVNNPIVQDIMASFNLIRRQMSDVFNRFTMVITGFDANNQHGGQVLSFRDLPPNAPYVPVIKEFAEWLDLLQKSMTRWSNQLTNVFAPRTTAIPMIH